MIGGGLLCGVGVRRGGTSSGLIMNEVSVTQPEEVLEKYLWKGWRDSEVDRPQNIIQET